jgi:chemotaxis protein methyltransferase CheR
VMVVSRDGSPRPTPTDMRRIASLVYSRSGIALRPDVKEAMVVARLQKRLRTGGFTRFADYLRHVEEDRTGTEMTALLDALTTNHTSFFREPAHFELLAERVVQPLVAQGGARPITGWSAACATGEEPYTIAITMLERVPIAQHDRIRLLASDISTRALATASAGTYASDRIVGVPKLVLRRYFQRGLGEQAGLVRVKEQVRNLIEFRRLNLMDIQLLGRTFDFIFCRNVMIYFDRDARQRAVSMLERHLAPNGFLFVSHSESLSEIQHGLDRCAPGVYQRSAA